MPTHRRAFPSIVETGGGLLTTAVLSFNRNENTTSFGPSETGQVKIFQPRQAIKIINNILKNSQKLNLTQQKKDEIKTLLNIRMKSNNGVDSLEKIAKQTSHPKSPISTKSIKKLNQEFVKRQKEAGQTIRRKSKDTTSIQKMVQDILSKNIHATQKDICKQLQINYRQLFDALTKTKTNLIKERKKARENAIKKLVQKNSNISTKQIAQQLGLKEDYIRKFLKRGNKLGARTNINIARKQFLFILGFFTNPKQGQLSLSKIIKITNISKPVANGAIKELKRQKLIWETQKEGSGEYCISPKGFRELNWIGQKTEKRNDRLEKMSLEELEQTKKLLHNSSLVGLSVDKKFMQMIDTLIQRKNWEEYKKNGFK
jgi:DNA-binding CsgD family transcriptional regulator